MPTFAARKKKDNTTKSETTEVVNATNTQLKFNILTDSTAEVINDDSYWSLISIEVPEKVRIADNIFTVTSVGSKAFEGCQSLTSIEIPTSVTSIENEAFSDCSSLTKINIPSSVKHIGEGAFFGCNTKKVTDMSSLFEGCKNLTNIKIPDNITNIGSTAFYRCSSLKKIEIPSSVTSIGNGAFYGCDELKSITVDPNNTNYSSEDGVLYNKDKTEIIVVPEAIKGKFTIPSSVIDINKMQKFEKH